MTGIHKAAGESRFVRCVAAALFLAVCAYTGAGLLGDLSPRTRTAVVRRASALDSVELEGLVVRRERPIRSPGGPISAADGQRLSAAAAAALAGEAAGPAVFFADADGLEDLTPELLEDLSPAGLQALLEREPERTGAGRLVTDYAWYYAALAPEETAADRGPCTLCFEGLEERVPARLIALSRAEEGQRVLLFRLTQGGRDYLSLRRTGARLILAEYSGLELPEEAVFTDGDGSGYVYTLSAGGTEKKPVEILYRTEGRCIAAASRQEDALREGSRVLLPG